MRRTHPIGPVRRVVLYPRDGGAALEATVTACQWLASRGAEVALPGFFAPDEPRLSAFERVEIDALPPGFDLMVALGGDGTLLRAARSVADLGVPVMGINLGNLGFLSAFGSTEVVDALQAAWAGELVWEARLRMTVEVRRGGVVRSTETGCNDCYVKHGALPRMLTLITTVGGHKMAEFRADGLIVSTPMGSTAYNLAAGGPIVDAGTDTFTITPICPHSLTHRPVVTSAQNPIGIAYTGPEDAGTATLSVDGQWGVPLEVGDEISVRVADRPLKLVPPNATVFEVLSHKLGWSGSGLPRP